GIVGAVREHYDRLSSRILAGILNRQQQRVIERRIVPSHAGAHAAHHLRSVGSQSRGPVKVAAIGIERYFVRAFQRANEIGDGILREDKATVHVIAGIKQDEDIGASKGRAKRFGPVFQRRARILYPTAPLGGGGFVRRVLANVGSNVYQ